MQMNIFTIKSTSLLAVMFLWAILSSAQVYNYADSVISFSSEYSSSSWHASQTLGHFDVYPCYGDLSGAWTSASSGSQREFIELYFNNAAPIDSIYIYETDGPGAIDTVFVKNPETDNWDVVYTATPVTINYSRILKIGFPLTTYDVSEVRISLDNPAVAGWNEIDAVAINSSPDELPDVAEMDCGDLSISIGDACNNNSIAGATYNWTTLNGNIVSGANQAHANVNAEGLYTLTVSKNGDDVSYDVQVTQEFQVPSIDPINDVVGCQSITLPPIIGTNLSGNEKYYTGINGSGTSFLAGDVIGHAFFNTYPATLYAFDKHGVLVDGCSDQKSISIVINEQPTVDQLDDETACDEFELPVLTVGSYYTQPGGLGSALNVGDEINTSQEIYIYAGIATCNNESSFDLEVVITPQVDELPDVIECDGFIFFPN